MTRRSHINLKTKLAAALCNMLRPDETGKLVPIIPHEHAKMMTEDQVLSVFGWDHYPIRKADNGPDAHWNLTPRPILEHRRKSATVDVPQMAKADRIIERLNGQRKPKRKIPSRPFEKGYRPLRSRRMSALSSAQGQ